MTIFIFLAALVFAAILVPFKVIAIIIGILAIQAVLIQFSANFVMGGTAFSKAFKAAIWSSLFTVVAAIAVAPAMLGSMGLIAGSFVVFVAIWFASVLAYSMALEATLGASAGIALLTSIIGYLATTAIGLGVSVGASLAG